VLHARNLAYGSGLRITGGRGLHPARARQLSCTSTSKVGHCKHQGGAAQSARRPGAAQPDRRAPFHPTNVITATTTGP